MDVAPRFLLFDLPSFLPPLDDLRGGSFCTSGWVGGLCGPVCKSALKTHVRPPAP